MKIHDVFDIITARFPDRTAVILGNKSLTYKELQTLSFTYAAYINSSNLKNRKQVILAFNRSIDFIIGIIAASRAGTTYIPIELDEDHLSLSGIIKEFSKPVILTNSKISALPSKAHEVSCLKNITKFTNDFLNYNILKTINNDLLYIIFTSGSTGTPKGVKITHASVLHYVKSIQKALELPECLHYAFVSSFSADLGNTALFLSLLTGGTLHILDNYTRKDPLAFKKYLSVNSIDVIKAVPSYIETIFKQNTFKSAKPALKYLILGGEIFSINLANWLIKNKFAKHIVNHYGPTETTIGVSLFKFNNLHDITSEMNSIPIGKPLNKTNLLLLDHKNQITGAGTGELYIGGPLTGEGYWKNKKLMDLHYYYISSFVCFVILWH